MRETTNPEPPAAPSGRLARAARLLALFAGGQAAVQVLNVVAGLLLIRVLSKEAYAQFTLGNASLSVLSGLIEFGFAPAIIALVAERIHDKQLIGKYVRSASFYRDRLLLFVGPLVAIGLLVLGHRQGWSLTVTLPMAVIVLAAGFSHGRVAYYTVPLKIHRRARDIYVPQVIGIIAKIAAFVALWTIGILGAVMAMGVHLAVTACVARLLRRRAISFYEPIPRADPDANRRMLHHLKPLIPLHLFTVFQGNILVFLVTILGTTDGIAEIGALGRLAQLFVFVSAIHAMLVIPLIARTPREELLKPYLLAATYPVAIAAVIVTFAFLFPGFILWLLGPGYLHLRVEVSWMILAGAIHYVGAALFHVHFSRRWLYWWSAFAHIIGVLTVQVIGILLLDLSRTLDAVFFALMTNMGILIVSIAVGFYGFHRGPRPGDPAEAITPEEA